MFEISTTAKPLRRKIWEQQVLWDFFVRQLGLTASIGRNIRAVKVFIFILSLFMFLYPIIFVVWNYTVGIIIISWPLLLMCLCGFLGFDLNNNFGG